MASMVGALLEWVGKNRWYVLEFCILGLVLGLMLYFMGIASVTSMAAELAASAVAVAMVKRLKSKRA